MEIIVLLSIGFMGLALIGTTGDDIGDDGDDFGDDALSDLEPLPPKDGDDEAPEAEEGQEFDVRLGEPVVGTNGDDLFALELDSELNGAFSVDAGAGNDVIDFTDPSGADNGWRSDYFAGDYRSDGQFISSNTIDGGAGDDTILANGYWVVEGGAGDDEITIFNGASTVHGGEGNDSITGDSANTDHSQFFGGGGDDTIDSGPMNNFDVFGGEGNDIIMTSELANGGSGYWAQADGGEGDDRLVHDASTNYQGDAGLFLTGGEGSDSFEISFSEASEYDDNSDEDSTLPIVSGLVAIVDFEVGVDQLQINVMISDNDYTVASAQLDENAVAGLTKVTVAYDHPTNTSREMVITLKGTGITWDDITFVGNNIPPVLIPA